MKAAAELRARIESPEFAVRCEIANGMRAYLSGLANSPELEGLVSLLRDDVSAQLRTLTRMREIADSGSDPRYVNPRDTALAGYCLAVAIASPRLSGLAAQIAQSAPNTWWARKTALSLQDQARTASDAATVSVTASSGPQGLRSSDRFSMNRSEEFLYSNVQAGSLRGFIAGVSPTRSEGTVATNVSMGKNAKLFPRSIVAEALSSDTARPQRLTA
jgi:hypothetical protein